MAVAFSFPQAQPTPLLGRTVELETVVRRLTDEQTRLLTLIGPAGVGKTRLALAAMDRLVEHFRDGVVFVDLSPVREPRQVLPALAQALGFTDAGTRPLIERLADYLRERTLLLVLDNFEHVLRAAEELPAVLAAAPRLRILVTSRVPLRLRWEQTLRLPPLPVPDLDAPLLIEEVVRVPSVALFVERAQAQRADFLPTEQQVALLVQLVHQLDGLPLAIELAAGQINVLPLAVIVRRLEKRLESVRWDARDLPERQRSLQAAISWSYDLLPEEQRVFRHLGVFVGRVTPDAMAAILADEDEGRILDCLVALADKSLIVPGRFDDQDPEPSFGMLETVRRYAAEQLQEQGEVEAAGSAHAHYFLALAERADPELRGRNQLVWYRRLESELDNLRAALRWLLDHDATTLALRMAGALGYFWEVRGYTAEGRRWLDEALARAPEADPGLRARALSWLGFLLTWSADEPEYPTAVLTEALALARTVQDRETIARSLMHLGCLDLLIKQWDQSRRELDEAMSYWRDLGNTWGIASTLLYRGGIELRQEHYQEATRLLEDSLARFRAMNDESALLWVLFSLAYTAGEQGNLSEAVTYLQELLQLSKETQNRRHLYLCGLGVLYRLRDQGDPEQLARLVGAMHQLREMMGIGWGKIISTAIPFLPLASEALRTRLGQEAFEAALAEGRALSFPHMAALLGDVLERAGQGGTPEEVPQECRQASRLSAREQEILHLVAQGLTSKQIGQQLFLSHRTVEHHLTSVFNKLGVETRSQAVAVAAREGFL